MGAEHVGLGADFVDQVADAEQELGVDELALAGAETLATGKARFGLEGFTGPDEYPGLVAALKGRGYDGEPLEAILNGTGSESLESHCPHRKAPFTGLFFSRPVSRILSRVTISLGRRLPDGSSGVPGSSAGSLGGACFTLHRTEFG